MRQHISGCYGDGVIGYRAKGGRNESLDEHTIKTNTSWERILHVNLTALGKCGLTCRFSSGALRKRALMTAMVYVWMS